MSHFSSEPASQRVQALKSRLQDLAEVFRGRREAALRQADPFAGFWTVWRFRWLRIRLCLMKIERILAQLSEQASGKSDQPAILRFPSLPEGMAALGPF